MVQAELAAWYLLGTIVGYVTQPESQPFWIPRSNISRLFSWKLELSSGFFWGLGYSAVVVSCLPISHKEVFGLDFCRSLSISYVNKQNSFHCILIFPLALSEK